MKSGHLRFAFSLLVCGMLFADEPLVGLWKRNPTLSKYFAEPAPKEMKLAIRPTNGSEYVFAVNGTMSDGRKIEVSYTATFDGRQVPIIGNPRYTTVAVTKIDPQTYEVVFYKAGQALRKDRSVLSNMGRVRTITARDAAGKVVAISVDEKQPE